MTIAENSMQRPSLTSLTRKAGAVTALALGLLVSGAYATNCPAMFSMPT